MAHDNSGRPIKESKVTNWRTPDMKYFHEMSNPQTASRCLDKEEQYSSQLTILTVWGFQVIKHSGLPIFFRSANRLPSTSY